MKGRERKKKPEEVEKFIKHGIQLTDKILGKNQHFRDCYRFIFKLSFYEKGSKCEINFFFILFEK